jgi:hypothetical protein
LFGGRAYRRSRRTASPSRGSCRRSRLMRGLLSLCKASALCWILLVFGLRSGRAGPSFRFRPKGCKVRAEEGSVSSQHGYLMIPPLHSPKSPHQDISRPRGQGAFSCYVPNRKVTLSFSAFRFTRNFGYQNVHEKQKANRSLQRAMGSPGGTGGRVCNTLRAYGDHDLGQFIFFSCSFAPGPSQRAIACRLSLSPVRFAQLSRPESCKEKLRSAPLSGADAPPSPKGKAF